MLIFMGLTSWEIRLPHIVVQAFGRSCFKEKWIPRFKQGWEKREYFIIYDLSDQSNTKKHFSFCREKNEECRVREKQILRMPFESPSHRKGTAQPFSLQVCAGIYIYHAVNFSIFFHFSLYRNANRLIKPNYFILSLSPWRCQSCFTGK